MAYDFNVEYNKPCKNHSIQLVRCNKELFQHCSKPQIYSMCPLFSKKHNKNDKGIIFSSEVISQKIFTHSATEKRKVGVLFHCDQMKYISPGEGGIWCPLFEKKWL